jgi:hypothetical protein
VRVASKGSGGLLPPSPPAEKAAAREIIFVSVGIRNSIIRQHDLINQVIFG